MAFEPNQVMGGLGQQVSSFGNLAMTIIGVVVVAGLFGGIMYFLYRQFFVYNVPVTLKYEVGDSIQRRQDKMHIVNTADKREVRFQKNKKIVAEVPDDALGFFTEKGKRAFEALVKNDQATWVYPKPIITQMVIHKQKIDDDGKPMFEKDGQPVMTEENVPSFITAPSNLIRYHLDRSRRNAELTQKLKWWQNPAVLQLAGMGMFIVAVIFIYLMMKELNGTIQAEIAVGRDFLEKAAGQVVP